MNLKSNTVFIVGLIFSIVGGLFAILGVAIAMGFYINGGNMTVNGVPVYYPPGTFGTGTIMFLAIFGGMGLLFLIMGFSFVASAVRRVRTIKTLIDGGVHVTARVSSVEVNRSVRVNGRHPYIIDCEYEDIYTGKIHVFRSDSIMNNPGDIVGTDITVYVDSNKWDLYYVDTEGLVSRYVYH